MCTLHMLPSPKQPHQLIMDQNLQNCEPKETFSLYKLIISGICYNHGKLTNTYNLSPILWAAA
jgi:hypothetical protein